jgi:cellulose biosynthesis protein BcsQ
MVVDLPAVLGPVTGAALLVADLVPIPTSLPELDVRATVRTVARVTRARRERPDRPLPALIVPSRIATGFGVARRVRRALGRLGEEIAPFLRADPVWAEAVREADRVGGASRLSRARRDLFARHAAVEGRLAGDTAPVAATAGISSPEPLPAR